MTQQVEQWTCEGFEISEPAWSTPGQPALVRDRPDLLSVNFLGKRRIILRSLWDQVHEINSRRDKP